MLKIKAEKNLEDLEKFGFKPYYNCNTGEVLYYYKDYFTKYDCYCNEYTYYQLKFYKNEIELQKGNRLRKKQIKKNFTYDTPPIYNGKVFDIFLDLIFDLIQAGYIKKVEE